MQMHGAARASYFCTVIPPTTMKKQLPLLSLLLLLACGQGPSAEQGATVAERTVREVAIAEGEPMATADLSIGGMSCQMMCANMIKGALAKLPGVSSSEVEYTDGQELGHAVVTYDPAQVDDAQLVSAVQGLAGGQYTVSSIAIVKQVKHGAAARPAKATDEASASLIPEVAMPNLVATLMALVRI